MSNCDSPYWVMPKMGVEKVPVPCGRCPICKHRRVNNWVFRLMQEYKRSVSGNFVTFTYDTRHVPISDNGFMTLRKKHFQDFMKRLRKLEPNRLKYYAVGEYGTHNSRPHYHAIIFNVVDTESFAKAWEFGEIHIGTVTGDSVAYTMKYIDKAGFEKKHARDDREPEFPLMSKRMGENYLTPQMVNYHKADIGRLYATKEGGHRIALPRYYRNKIYTEQDQKRQLTFIQDVMNQQQIADMAQYEQVYGRDNPFTFHDWMESRRFGRYRTFTNHIKNNRNL